jgi:NAD(P)H-hydrate epimerase
MEKSIMKPIDMNVIDINCEDLGLSRLCLMENAGKSLSDEISKFSTIRFSRPVKIAIFTGSGGNGGDGFVAARHLLNRGFEVDVFMLTDFKNIKSTSAKANAEILRNMNPTFSRLNIHYIESIEKLEDMDIGNSNNYMEHIIIDGILGTGIKGKLRQKIRRSIEIINNFNSLKISIDIPSGMNPETGNIEDIAIKPDYTLTFHKTKSGLRKADKNLVGEIINCDIGIPIEAEIFLGKGDLLRLKNRSDYSYKGKNGKILIVGGNKYYSGAPSIAGLSALSTGVDLVYIATTESASIPIKSYLPDFIVKSLKGEYLNSTNLKNILAISNDVDAVLIGVGAGLEKDTGKLFNSLVSKIQKPMVIDADGLKLIDLNLIKNREDIIITPHFNEFKSFFSEIINDLSLKEDFNDLYLNWDGLNHEKLEEKIDIFQNITNSIKGTTILKGKNDLIFKENKLRINKTGNPGMTVGGTGDSLGGIAVSLLAQGLNSYDAGGLATYLNGRAGDLAMEKYGQGFMASQISEFLGALMSNIIK